MNGILKFNKNSKKFFSTVLKTQEEMIKLLNRNSVYDIHSQKLKFGVVYTRFPIFAHLDDVEKNFLNTEFNQRYKSKKQISYDSEVEKFGPNSEYLNKLQYGKMDKTESRDKYLRYLYPDIPNTTEYKTNTLNQLEANPQCTNDENLEFDGSYNTFLICLDNGNWKFPSVELKFGQTLENTLNQIENLVFFESSSSLQYRSSMPISVVIEDQDQPEEVQVDYDVQQHIYSSVPGVNSASYKKITDVQDKRRREQGRLLGHHQFQNNTFQDALDLELDELHKEKKIQEKGTKTFLFQAFIHDDCKPKLSKDADFDQIKFATKFDMNKQMKEKQWKDVIHSLSHTF